MFLKIVIEIMIESTVRTVFLFVFKRRFFFESGLFIFYFLCIYNLVFAVDYDWKKKWKATMNCILIISWRLPVSRIFFGRKTIDGTSV